MGFLDTGLWGNSLRTWLIALFTAAGLFVLLLIVRSLLRSRFLALAERRETLDTYNLIYHIIHETKVSFLLLSALIAGSLVVSLPFQTVRILEGVFKVGLILQVGFWLSTIVSHTINRRIQNGMRDQAARATTLNAVRLVLTIAVWTVVVLMALQNLGVRVDTLIASLGVTGIVVGLALQNVLGDLFASLSIALDQPFVLGDYIIVGDFQGTVEHVGLKSTRVRSISGEQLVFSNSDLLSSRIRNFKRMARRRVAFNLNTTFQTPVDKIQRVIEICREAIARHEAATFDRAHFKAFTDSSLQFEVVYFIENPEYDQYMDLQQAINLEIMQRFEEERIQFAYPTQTVFVQSAEVQSPQITREADPRSG